MKQMGSKIKTLIRAQLVQGFTPEGLALTCAMGIVMGIFPVLGLTTIFLIGLGYVFKLNQPLLQTINYAMTPIHLLMLPVFYTAGGKLSSTKPPSLDPRIFIKEFFNDLPLFFHKYTKAGLLAILVWAIAAPFVGAITYFITHYLFVKIKKQMNKLGSQQ
jgi:uncharacterized protein (DUF2062 family)